MVPWKPYFTLTRGNNEEIFKKSSVDNSRIKPTLVGINTPPRRPRLGSVITANFLNGNLRPSHTALHQNPSNRLNEQRKNKENEEKKRKMLNF